MSARIAPHWDKPCEEYHQGTDDNACGDLASAADLSPRYVGEQYQSDISRNKVVKQGWQIFNETVRAHFLSFPLLGSDGFVGAGFVIFFTSYHLLPACFKRLRPNSAISKPHPFYHSGAIILQHWHPLCKSRCKKTVQRNRVSSSSFALGVHFDRAVIVVLPKSNRQISAVSYPSFCEAISVFLRYFLQHVEAFDSLLLHAIPNIGPVSPA